MNGFVVFKWIGMLATIGIIVANVITVYEQLDQKVRCPLSHPAPPTAAGPCHSDARARRYRR